MKKKGDKKLKGTIVLEPDFKISVSSIKSHCFQIMPHDKSKRIYYIHGENDKEAEEWITTLEKAKMVSSTPLVPSTPSTPNSVKVENKETKKEEPNIEEKGNKTGKKDEKLVKVQVNVVSNNNNEAKKKKEGYSEEEQKKNNFFTSSIPSKTS